ncbi:unnamed protein product [Periconia digitata]|uniref:Uncharacterized protein n=1 Tax=Periconia digitata TaxID=1303443 RepID=A0A9W4U5I9_9PLEO|nr:unnamed protein product [Periconia digitata]
MHKKGLGRAMNINKYNLIFAPLCGSALGVRVCRISQVAIGRSILLRLQRSTTTVVRSKTRTTSSTHQRHLAFPYTYKDVHAAAVHGNSARSPNIHPSIQAISPFTDLLPLSPSVSAPPPPNADCARLGAQVASHSTKKRSSDCRIIVKLDRIAS